MLELDQTDNNSDFMWKSRGAIRLGTIGPLQVKQPDKKGAKL